MSMDVVAPKRRRAQRGQGAQLREELLVAAEALLFKYQDLSAVSIQAVCDAVGCTPPAVYKHFVDKTELVHTVCARIFATFDDFIASQIENVDDPTDRMIEGALAYIEFGLTNPEAYRLLFMHRAEEQVRPMPDRSGPTHPHGFGRMVASVREAVDEGVFEGDPWEIACHIWMGVHGIVSLLISKPRFPWPDAPDFRRRAVEAVCAPFRTR
jgi:AcrR family transcriptional regulator